MSSHIFEEVERTCDNVLVIKEGKIITQSDITSLKNAQRKAYLIKTPNPAETSALMQSEGFEIGRCEGDETEVFVSGEAIGLFGKTLGQVELMGLDVKSQSLEDIFMKFYADEV